MPINRTEIEGIRTELRESRRRLISEVDGYLRAKYNNCTPCIEDEDPPCGCPPGTTGIRVDARDRDLLRSIRQIRDQLDQHLER